MVDVKKNSDFIVNTKWIAAHAVSQNETLERIMPNTAGKTTLCRIPCDVEGTAFRIVLGETYSREAVRYGMISVELDGRLTTVTFDGEPALRVESGSIRHSDPVAWEIRSGSEIKLWFYTEGEKSSQSATIIPQNHSKDGNFCGKVFVPEPFDPAYPGMVETLCGYRALEVKVNIDANPQIIAAFGDSITGGNLWVEPLRERLRGTKNALFNMGISGNRLLRDTNFPVLQNTQFFGMSGLKRFDQDILETPGIGVVMLALGVNDISQPGGTREFSPPVSERCTTGELLDGYREVIRRCHTAGIKVAGCTITPFGGYLTYGEETAVIRNEVNEWIRQSGEFDMVIDFDHAVRDSDKPDFYRAECDSGDHLHPSAAGGKAMADCVDVGQLISLFCMEKCYEVRKV
jgi:lysophospholipase L1-like esterase